MLSGDGRTIYFIHTPSRALVTMEEVDSLVLNTPNLQEDGLTADLDALGIPYRLVGDALSPRTAEEAVYEGMLAGIAV